MRRLLLAVVLVGLASSAVDRLDRPQAEAPRVVPSDFPGMRATAEVLSEEALRVRLVVEVRIDAEPVSTGLPGSSATAAQVRLQQITSPGLVVRLGDRRPPVLLGYVGRFGSGLEQVVQLPVEVVVLGCAEPERPRRLSLSVTRSSASSDLSATVPVEDRPEVAEALSELVRRSCA